MEQIILIGHGSPRKEANNIEVIGNLLHNTIHPGCDKQCVRVSYLQFGEPDIAETIRICSESGSKQIILHPFFLSPGMHVTKDIPEMVDQARLQYPGIEFIYSAPLGLHENLVKIVIDRIRAATFKVPEDIEKRSFEIIADEEDLSGIPPEQQPVVTRVIHATADFEFKKTLVFHPEAIAQGIAALRAGKDILTDVQMVRTGINKKLLSAWGGRVICNLPEKSSTTALPPGITRSEIGIERALKENNNIGIIAIGNAPTALLKTIELLNNSSGSSLVVGVPVGFVKALESKSLLAAQSFPFITNLSRKGGSSVAVAIVNSLLKMAHEAQA